MENYTKTELEKAISKIKIRVTKGIEKDLKKKVIILGGQPGAGKTKLSKLHSSKGIDYIVISGDDYRKEPQDTTIYKKNMVMMQF